MSSNTSARAASLGVDPPPDPLAFEQTEEALHRGIVMAVATSTHAAHQTVGHQETAPVIAGVDRPLVRVNQATGAGLAPPHRRQQGLHGQLGIGSIAHRPADDLPGKQIDHHSQVHPAFMRTDKGEVARPGRIRLGHLELPIQQVGCRLARHSAMEARFATIAHLARSPSARISRCTRWRLQRSPRSRRSLAILRCPYTLPLASQWCLISPSRRSSSLARSLSGDFSHASYPARFTRNTRHIAHTLNSSRWACMRTYFAFTPWQSTRRPFRMSRLRHPAQLGLQPPNLGALVHFGTLHHAGLAERTQPGVQAVRGDTQPLCDLCHLEATIGHLPDRFDLELIRIPLAAHGHLRISHFL